MAQVKKVRYSAKAHTAGGRDGLERDVAQSVVDGARPVCPYSKATRGNVDAALVLV